MRLDANSLNVESFETAAAPIEVIEPITGPGGPESYCYICYPTGNTDPACNIDPETRFHPCTYNLTCSTCV